MHYFNQDVGGFRNIAIAGQMFEALRATRGSVRDCVATCGVLDTDESGKPYEKEEEGNA